MVAAARFVAASPGSLGEGCGGASATEIQTFAAHGKFPKFGVPFCGSYDKDSTIVHSTMGFSYLRKLLHASR